MRLRVRHERFTTLLLAALGLGPLAACGGAAFGTGPGEGGDAGSGGENGTGSGAGGGPATGAGGDIVGGTGGGSYGVGGGVISGTGGAGVGGFLGTGGGPANPFPCTPVATTGADLGGYVRCQNGLVHRPAKAQCPSSVPRPQVVFTIDGGIPDGGFPNACQRDTDCSARPNGYCGYANNFGGPQAYPLIPTCTYGCLNDGECGMGQICVCGNPVGRCESASCTVDGQCGGGLYCASYVTNPGCPGESFACQSPNDQCATDADCSPPTHCTFQQGRRICSPIMCAVGRPFLVDGSARTASAAGGVGWSAPDRRPTVKRISKRNRALLAEAWTKVGLMEHASIAAFARFTLQLMSLGAPADLVERSNAAIADETRHAKLAFGIASAYAGSEIGPGKLDVRGALEGMSLEKVLVDVIHEGCIGETVAAVEAAEALEHAVDPAVRSALARITEDELRHAELAWQFARWAIDNGGEKMREVARQEFESVRCAHAVRAEVRVDARDVGLLAGGILPAALKAEVHASTVERVVLACAAALLDAPSLASAAA